MSVDYKKIGTAKIKCKKCGCEDSNKYIHYEVETDRVIAETCSCVNCGEFTYINDINKLSKPIIPYTDILYANNAQCPYCGSKNTKKISTTSKVVNTALFGIFALGKTTKQWHCNSCKSDF